MAGSDDETFMTQALKLARGGDPSPNPHVGSLVVKDGNVIGQAFHEAAGLDHAEVLALRSAGSAARGATLYVTLEPCNHEGRTSPCVDAILDAGVRRVVIGCRDPNPQVRGGGADRLREAGIAVVEGVLENEAATLIAAWTKYITGSGPFVALKLAVSLDGRIATRTGESQWITGEASRARVHALRATHDAVLVGVNTLLADDPLLTVRDVPGRNPARVVVDSKLRTPRDATLVKTAREIPTCLITTTDASPGAAELLENEGVSIIRVPATAEGRCDMRAALKELAMREVVTVLVEGGAELAGSLLALELADELHVFVAPVLLGPRGRPAAVDWAGPAHVADTPRIKDPRWEICGRDAYVAGTIVYPQPASSQRR